MAIKQNEMTDFGLEIKDAYARVESVTLTSKNIISFVLKSYVSDANSNSFKQRVFGCAYDINGTNPIAQAYQHLKTLPEFANALDC
jgi:hypothetical protein